MDHFYFIRHGETVWNVENKICGATDIELTAKGHEQAIETGKKILSEGIKADKILSSPLVRASETARHISEITGIPRKTWQADLEQASPCFNWHREFTTCLMISETAMKLSFLSHITESQEWLSHTSEKWTMRSFPHVELRIVRSRDMILPKLTSI